MWPRSLVAVLASALLAVILLGAGGSASDEAEGSASERVVGGGPARAEGWQFAAALKLRDSIFFCGGALIAPTKVLTAAHCVKRVKRRKLLVATGSPWISGRRAGPRLPVSRIRIHPDYNGRKAFHDLAVVTLARPSAAPPARLPTAAEAKAATAPGRVVRVAGWGSRSAWGFRAAQRLKSARQRVYGPRKCQRAYTKDGFRGASMICAVGARVRRIHGRRQFRATDCFGDSGGPLVANTSVGQRLVGVVSVGAFPCGLGGPSIYSRVSDALPFIRRVMAQP